jgi:hypothetical protein
VSQEFLWLGTGTVRELGGRGTYAVGSRHQRAGEGPADREDSVGATVNCTMCEMAIAKM